MRSAVPIALLLASLSTTFGQDQPDAAAILKKVSDTYRRVTQYQFSVVSRPGPGAPEGLHAQVAVKLPDKYRMTGLLRWLDPEPDLGDEIIVDDGITVWVYVPKSNQYASVAAAELPEAPSHDVVGMGPQALDSTVMGSFRTATDNIQGSRLVREETLNLDGREVACYVIEIPRLRATWWVDKTRYYVVRVDDVDSSEIITNLKLNEPLSDDLFKFEPPAGAKKLN